MRLEPEELYLYVTVTSRTAASVQAAQATIVHHLSAQVTFALPGCENI